VNEMYDKRPAEFKEHGKKHHPLETRKLSDSFFSENNGFYLAVNRITGGSSTQPLGERGSLGSKEVRNEVGAGSQNTIINREPNREGLGTG